MPGQRDEWARELERQKQSGHYPRWPNEAMLKVIFGSSYLKTPLKPQANWRVLDVGCFFGNNLIPFADIGCECHGVDIHPEIALKAAEVMAQRGFKATFKEGSNRSLPYPENHFDLLLSVGTLHYEGRKDRILAALKEFRRVLKPGGCLYLCTTAPLHDLEMRSEAIGEHRYQIRDWDFRDGTILFFFDSDRYLHDTCNIFFENVETGRVTERLMSLTVDSFIAVCR